MPDATADAAARFRRAARRRAGVASGVSRRRLARRRRGIKPGTQRGLALTYELRRVSRQEFDDRYQRLWPVPERATAAASWERGREAVWTHVNACYALLAARGQHCRTTNGQRAAALSARQAPRCRRTLQRYSRKLEALGLATVLHVRKPPGQKDCLAIEWHVTRRLRMLHVTPPPGTTNTRLRRGCLSLQSTATTSVPPPSAADGEPPDEPAGRQITEQEGVESRRRFLQLRLEFPFGDLSPVRRELAQLDGQERARIASMARDGRT